MNVFRSLQEHVRKEVEALAAAGALPPGLDCDRVLVEPARDPAHGDAATNAALVLARDAGMKPRDLAAQLQARLQALDAVDSVEIAGPGFLNMRLSARVFGDLLVDVLRLGDAYGAADIGGGRKVNVEYVSANPTGPLTVAHARGAVVGDVLATLLQKVGYDVTREYYVNDAGAQVDTLARSAYLRYREALGEAIGEIPEGLYPGDYLKDVGQALKARDGDRWRDAPEAEWLPVVRAFAIDAMMRLIRDDLVLLGVRQEVVTSERSLVEQGRVDEVLSILEHGDHLYVGTLEPPKGAVPEDWEPRPQTLFRATDFGDDVDRPLRKSDGSWTYFASDIANHLDKYRRGFAIQIDVWGADHGGYIKRMQAATKAVTDGQANLDVKICQMVRLLDQGQQVRMSKRAGRFVTLREVIERVGKDVVRFIMLTRKNDAPLDFDLTKVTEQSRENPVFYVQYAHARAHSVRRMAEETFPDMDLGPGALARSQVELLTGPDELALIKLIAAWPRVVESAAEAHEPHRLAFYLYDLAAAFHGLWTKGKEEPELRFVLREDRELTRARLALVQAMAFTVAAGLQIFGVQPVEEMR